MPTKLQTLQEHCRLFEERLGSAAGPEDAWQALESICGSLEAACQSEIVGTLLREHAETRIRERFSR